MSSLPNKPITISLEFYDTKGNLIHGVPIVMHIGMPVPFVGEEVEFNGKTWLVLKRRFFYSLGNLDQLGDVRVVFTCDSVQS